MAQMNLFMKLRADATQFVRGMRDGSQSMEDFGDSLDDLKGKVIALLAVWVSLEGIKSLAGAIINTSAAFETLNTQLETLTGSSILAERAMDWIRKFTADTPYGLEDVSEAYLKLISVGLNAESMLAPIGNAVAALGGGSEEIGRVTTALSQMQSKGKASAEELMQIAEVGIPAFQILKEKLQLTADQMNDIGNSGYDVQQVMDALMEGMGERFDGAMKKQSQTFNGILGLIGDQWTQFLAEAGDAGFFDDVKAALQEVLDTIVKLRETGQLELYAQRISDALSFALSSVRLLVDGIVLLGDTIAYPLEKVYELGMLIGSGFDLSVFDLQTQQLAEGAQKLGINTNKAQADYLLAVNELESKITQTLQEINENRVKFQVQTWQDEKKSHEDRLKEGEKAESDYAKKIENLRKGLADFNLSLEDKIRAKQRERMSDARAQADIEKEIGEKLAASKAAAAEGDIETAKARADEALSLAESIENNKKSVALMREAGEAIKSARSLEISATEEAKDKNLEHMESLKLNLDFIGQELEKLGVKRTVVVEADITEAESKLKALEASLAKLSNPSTSPGTPSASLGFNKGGQLPGYSPTEDNIPAQIQGGQSIKLAGGEYIINAQRTRMMQGLLNFLNFAPLSEVQKKLTLAPQPILGFSGGGQTPSANSTTGAGAGAMTQLNWQVGKQRGTLLTSGDISPLLRAIENELQGM
jgi:tape measure domain-containing protein